MNYEDRLVIYIDVLGFSDFVNYTTISRINVDEKVKQIDSFLAMVRNFFNENENSAKLSTTKQITSFSDLLIVSIDLKEIDNIDLEIMEVYYLLLNAINKGFLLRGSIVYGKLIHNKEVIFGSGLIEAYNREKTIAKYPRVIIDKAIVKDIRELSINDQNINIDDVISCDSDGLYYIDIFKNTRNYLDSFWQYVQILKSLSKILISMLENPMLIEKTNWLLRKYVDNVNENSKAINYSLDISTVNSFELDIFIHYLHEFDDEKFKKMK